MKTICIIGPMLGDAKKYKITPGETLAQFLRLSDYQVIEVSHFANRYLRFLDILFSIWKLRKQIDLVIIQVFGYRSFIVEDLASALSKHLGIPIIMVLHGGSLPKMAVNSPNWIRRVLGRADELVAPSPFLDREIGKLGLQIQVIPNIIDINQYPYQIRTEVKPLLFWMRSFEWYYNPLLALKVLKLILKTRPDARLIMAGPDNGMLQKIKQETTSMGLDAFVTLPGMLSLNEKIKFAASSDIFLNTNLIDNMPVTLLEMAALGLPIISTSVGGIPDLITDRINGLLIENNDERKMADAVLELLENPSLANSLSREGRRLSENFSWETTKSKWITLIESVAN